MFIIGRFPKRIAGRTKGLGGPHAGRVLSPLI